ncbi:amidase [Nocardia sp. NPDC052566]|uniref:amidase n=1 Tax=Nocardia sp. NPDC052566 TaxID=3364330 RepID=UPI0037C7EADC
MVTGDRVHAFTGDALGEHDAVGLAELVRDGQVSPRELADAAAARARAVEPQLNAIVFDALDNPRLPTTKGGRFYGVPSFVKDNTDVRGMPTGHGSAAFRARPAKQDTDYTRQFLSTGVSVLGKTTLSEFGLSPTTEWAGREPTRNPWHTGYSVGASSGGSAALVAAGVVPFAHGNDGGGSIRIPAACAGLVGLKPSRYRHVDGPQARQLPIKLVSEGVLTRTVRDTAAYLAAAEEFWRNPALRPVGMVHGPGTRELRVGLLIDTVTGAQVDPQTKATVEQTASLLEKAGHSVEPVAAPVGTEFVADFLQYWELLADVITLTGKLSFDRSFDSGELDPLTRGLARGHRAHLLRTPGALLRLRKAAADYARAFDRFDIVVSPVLAHITPPLGYLSPAIAFDVLLQRLTDYVGYTPLQNVAGAPGISLPMGLAAEGVPIGVHLSAAHGDERTLLEAAYTLEAAQPFPRIQP